MHTHTYGRSAVNLSLFFSLRLCFFSSFFLWKKNVVFSPFKLFRRFILILFVIRYFQWDVSMDWGLFTITRNGSVHWRQVKLLHFLIFNSFFYIIIIIIFHHFLSCYRWHTLHFVISNYVLILFILFFYLFFLLLIFLRDIKWHFRIIFTYLLQLRI